MTVGQKIRQLRKERRITQEDLANRLHIPTRTVSYWEKGKFKPSFENIRGLCRIFNLTFEELTEGVD